MITLPDWLRIANVAEIDSPALLIFEERMEGNLRQMIERVGDADRLRPHIKTHKMPRLIRRQLDLGISRFKAATIAESEMCAAAGARDILLAFPPVGPRAERLLRLAKRFPDTSFSVTVDDREVGEALARVFHGAGWDIEFLLDIDCGQHRTGIAAGPAAFALYRDLATMPGLRPGGLHVYDGHLHDKDPVKRAKDCAAAFAPTDELRRDLLAAGIPVPRIVAGGTPTFPMHARRADVECSPGTCVLWDHGYATQLPDMGFLPAAALLTRVVSRPLPHRLCLDLGHKAVASEMPHPRVHLPQIPDAVFAGHSEEHLLVETPHAEDYPVGTVLFAIPWHICPTVALHSEAVLVRGGVTVERWKVQARDRRIEI
ncbi:MAG: D-TA family PLP-dependent enzyme [Verrucomicrobia bacterium]|nr:D-TA family PLP-dependent enzyme [Verrucomicrobiota bacterium]